MEAMAESRGFTRMAMQTLRWQFVLTSIAMSLSCCRKWNDIHSIASIMTDACMQALYLCSCKSRDPIWDSCYESAYHILWVILLTRQQPWSWVYLQWQGGHLTRDKFPAGVFSNTHKLSYLHVQEYDVLTLIFVVPWRIMPHHTEACLSWAIAKSIMFMHNMYIPVA